MGFFSVLYDINKNRTNFKQWEKEEKDNDAKRKELYSRHPLSDEQLAQKQKLADTIIDTITIMDQQSEDVSEDVESFTQPITAVSLNGGALGGGYLSHKLLNPKFEKIDKELRELANQITREQLSQIRANNPDYRGFLWEKAIIQPGRKEKKLIIPDELKPHIDALRKEAQKKLKSQKALMIGLLAATAVTAAATYLTSVFMTTKLQVGSSRIARYQAREKLNDPKNFVIYTDEQIAQAKENLKNKEPEKKSLWSKFKNQDEDNTGITGTFKNIKNLIADKKKYAEWKKENDKRDPRIKRQLTAEEVQEAKSDKEVIQRITKKINNRAEEYSENMETAATVILGSSILGGPILGGAVSWILNKIGTGDKIAKSVIGKFANKEAVEIYKKLTTTQANTQEYKELKKQFSEAVNDALYQNGRYSGRFDMILQTIKKYSAEAMTTEFGRNKAFALVSGAVTSIAGVLIALKLQKAAARAGRYNAKEEFRNNPQEFISYTEEEMNQVKDVKAEEETLSQKFKDYMTFLPRVFKQHKQYEKYKKGEYKQDKALREELTKLEVSDEQLREGKNLQRKLFNTFEKIDDKSQEYSENMEAATEIATQVSITGGYLAMVAPFIAGAAAIKSGKGAAVVTTLLNALSKISFIAKSKFFKNYLGEVAQNIENRVTSIPDYVANYNFDTADKMELNILQSLVGKFVPELKNFGVFASKEIANILKKTDSKTINALLEKLANGLDEKELISKLLAKDEQGLINLLRKNSCTQKEIDFVTSILKTLKLQNEKSILSSLPQKELLNNLMENYLNKVIAEIKIIPQDAAKLKESLKVLEQNKKMIIRGLNSFERIAKNIPAEEITNAIQKLINVSVENPEKFIEFVKNPPSAKSILMTPNLKTALKVAMISWGVFTTGIMFAVQSYFAKLQKEAGRLGVMKAMEELQDDRIYADEHPKTQQAQATASNNLPSNIQALLKK